MHAAMQQAPWPMPDATMIKTAISCFVLLLWTSADISAFTVLPALSRKTSVQSTRPSTHLRHVASSDNEASAVTSFQPIDELSATHAPTRRSVKRIQKYARLPVWPVWNGVFIWLVQKVFGDQVAAKLEDSITGRVCPNFYEYDETSPFIMLVHHCHSFAPWDPLRFIQRTFFPEGFPAHPHRGFVTLTYFLNGGFLHRDSMGVKQTYGAEPRHEGKHTQWLDTGAGMLHEEMFDLENNKENNNNFLDKISPVRQELYQLWLNVPASHKMDSPETLLLGGEKETPTIVLKDDEGRESETLVLAGTYQDSTAAAPISTDLSILHVRLDPDAVWNYALPPSFEAVVCYVRKGTMYDGSTLLPTHHTVYFSSKGDQISLKAGKDGADFMLLSGVPIREPCSAQGSMVMNTGNQINQAYSDYQLGKFGRPWDHKLSDSEWEAHVNQFPSLYANGDSEESARTALID